MRVLTVALFLGCAWLLSADPASGQKPKADPEQPTRTARVEVDAHEHCLTVRFFLKNDGEKEAEVVYGSGGSGMRVVPQFEVAGVTITPPVYHRPPRRSMKPDVKRIPAGKEILYGTFTMGYPPVERERERDVELSAVIHFEKLKATLRTEPQRLKIPAQKQTK